MTEQSTPTPHETASRSKGVIAAGASENRATSPRRYPMTMHGGNTPPNLVGAIRYFTSKDEREENADECPAPHKDEVIL